jgi:ribosome-binding protein aMBF1 (putative translation factor)
MGDIAKARKQELLKALGQQTLVESIKVVCDLCGAEIPGTPHPNIKSQYLGTWKVCNDCHDRQKKEMENKVEE